MLQGSRLLTVRTHFVRGPVKVLGDRLAVDSVKIWNWTDSPKQAFPSTQNSTAEADDR